MKSVCPADLSTISSILLSVLATFALLSSAFLKWSVGWMNTVKKFAMRMCIHLTELIFPRFRVVPRAINLLHVNELHSRIVEGLISLYSANAVEFHNALTWIPIALFNFISTNFNGGRKLLWKVIKQCILVHCRGYIMFALVGVVERSGCTLWWGY